MTAAFLRKYATATHIYVPMIKRGVVDFAVGADWTPAAGDVKVSIDGGAVSNIGTLPVAIASGNGAFWDFTVSTGETTGKKTTITVVDSATKAVEDQCIVIETYGHASAEYQADLSAANLPANVVQFGGSNATSSGGRPEVNTVQFNASAVIQSGGRPEVNTTHAAGSAVTAAAGRMEVNVSHFGGVAGTFASGRPEVNSTHFAGTAFASAIFTADVTKFNGVAVTSAAGRPEVNTTHIGGTVQTAVDAGARLDATVSSRATPAQVNTEVLDVLTVDTHAEVGAVPVINTDLRSMIRWLFTLGRNKITQTDALTTLRNDADNADIATSATSDDGTTAIRGKYS